MKRQPATQTVVIQGVQHDNVSPATIDKMVASKLIYLAIDGIYYSGYSLEFDEMSFTKFIDADRIDAAANGTTVSLD